MKFTTIRDLQFYKPTPENMYALVTLPKGTEVIVLNNRQTRRLSYLEQDAIKRMRKRERNTVAFMWEGLLRTAVTGKDLIQTKAKSRSSFLQGLISGKD